MTPPENRPVLCRDPGGEHLRLLDGVRDVQGVRRAEQVVVDVDAVNQKDVVVGKRSVDRHLAGVRRVVGQARLQLGDRERRPARRQGVDLVRRDVGAGYGGFDRRRDDADHLCHLRDAGGRHGGIHPDVAAQRHRRHLVDGGEPRQLEDDVVLARRQRQDLVVPVDVRNGRAHALQRGGPYGYRHARQHEPLGVDHGTPNGAGLAALRQRGRVQRDQQRRAEHEQRHGAAKAAAPRARSSNAG